MLCFFISFSGKHLQVSSSLLQRYSCFFIHHGEYLIVAYLYVITFLMLNLHLQIICEFLISKDEAVSHFKRRQPNILLMQVLGLYT